MAAKNFVSLITGGASGLGRGAAEYLAKKGSRVVIVDLASQRDEADKLVKHIGSESAIFVPTDVTTEEDVKEAMGQTKARFGRLDAVVNCAGVACAFSTYNFNKKMPHSLHEFNRVMLVNVTGTFNVTRLAAGLMGENEASGDDGSRGVIVNTASIAAFDGQRGQAAYAASKGAIAAMTLPLARDLSVQGIRCVCIAPGLFDTPLLAALPPKVVDFLSKTVPHPPRLGKVEDFARLVHNVITNPYINGEVIRIDGGLRMVG